MLDENSPELTEQEKLKNELRELQRRQTSAIDWDPKTEGKRVLELQEMLSPPNNTKPPIELTRRQTVAGTIIEGKRQPELSTEERAQIISGNQSTPLSNRK